MSKLNVTSTTPINAMLTRVIGSTDIRGQGTNHAIEDINPFSLLDEGAVFTKKNTPPFGRHPHADGKEVTEEFGPGPFLLALSCNRGVVHDEHTSSDKPTKLLQLVWMTGDQSSDCSFEHVDKPKVLKEENYEIMLCCGSFRDVASGISCKQNPSVTVLVIKMSPGSIFKTDEFKDGNVFVYSVDYEEKRGPLAVNDREVPSANVADMTMDASNSQLKIENQNDHSVSVLIGYGKPIQPKCKKLLMFNGFIFAPTEDELKKKEDEFKQVGAERFGQKPSGCNLM